MLQPCTLSGKLNGEKIQKRMMQKRNIYLIVRSSSKMSVTVLGFIRSLNHFRATSTDLSPWRNFGPVFSEEAVNGYASIFSHPLARCSWLFAHRLLLLAQRGSWRATCHR